MDALRLLPEHLSSFNEGVRAAYDFGSRVQLVTCIALLSAVYLHTFVRRFAPGLKSLIFTIPVLLLNIWAPMLFSSRTELVTRVVLGLLLFWLANFKAVGLCINRGPIASKEWNFFQVFLLYTLPLYPRQDGPVKKGRLTDSAGPTSKLLRRAVGHAVALSALAYVLAEVPLPTPLKHYIYGIALCSFTSFIMNGPAALLTGLADLDVVPPFDKPWFSTSLVDFWSRRWNNTVSLTLRSLVYDPIVEGNVIHRERTAAPAAPAGPETQDHSRPSAAGQKTGSASSTDSSSLQQQRKPRVHPLTRLAGTAATFAVSGIMHEFILLYALHDENVYPAGFWFMFFLIQVPLLVLEDMARRRLRKAGVRLARPVGVGWTYVAILFTAYFLWYPPVEHYTDVALRIVTAVNEGAAQALGSGQMLLQQFGLFDAAGRGALVSSVS